MADPHAHGRPQGGPKEPDAAGKSAGKNTQSQGGIGRKAAREARERHDPGTGLPGGPLGRRAPVTGQSLDAGGGGEPGDGRVHEGLGGDDGGHLATASRGAAPSLQPGRAGDLGPQGDTRLHGLPADPAERVTGADSPNRGAIDGSPGGPARAPRSVRAEDEEQGTGGGGQSGNDPQRDSQI